MRWRIEFERKETAQKAGQLGRAFAVELSARNETEAREAAKNQVARERRGDAFNISRVRKI